MLGLNFRDLNFRIRSNKVYKASKLGRLGYMLQGDSRKNVFIEFELSEEYIIMTLSRGWKKGVKRIALVGDFQYKDDDLDSGIIFGAANDDIYTKKQPNSSRRNYGQTWAPQDGKGIQIQNTNFGSSFGLALNALIKEENLQSQYDICRDNDCDFSYSNSYESMIKTEGVKVSAVEQAGGYSAVKRWMGLNIFDDYWWDKPFKTNLLNGQVGGDKRIDSPTKFSKKSVDEITNFNPSTDKLEIDTNSFSIAKTATFAAAKNAKTIKNQFSKFDIDFLYDRKKGGLYFNENGADKGFGDGGIIAILDGAPELTSENIDFI